MKYSNELKLALKNMSEEASFDKARPILFSNTLLFANFQRLNKITPFYRIKQK